MFRAYYATAYSGNIMKNSKGLHTNCLFAFSNMLEKFTEMEFTHILFAFDAGKKNFRHEKMESYKDGRKAMPEELREQIPHVYELIESYNMAAYKHDGFEADDIIGTLAAKYKNDFDAIDIYTSDKDLLQLINDNTFVNLTKKGITDVDRCDRERFKELFNINVEQFIDYKALTGDSSDNIKGVPGIGPKAAEKLLNTYQSLEGIYNNLDKLKGKQLESLTENKEEAFLCQEIVTIVTNMDIDKEIDEFEHKGYENSSVLNKFREYEFKQLIQKYERIINSDETILEVGNDLFSYSLVDNLDKIIMEKSSIVLEYYGRNYHRATPLGFAITNKLGTFYIDFNDAIKNNKFIDFMSDENIEKYTYDLKSLYVIMNKYCELRGFTFDLLIATYVSRPSKLDEIRVVCDSYYYHDISYEEEIYGKYGTKKYLIPDDKNKYIKYACEKSYAISKLREESIKQLKDTEQYDLYKDIELKLSVVLAKMEIAGVKVDLEELERQRDILGGKVINIEDKIFEIAGKELNISSTKQLGELLFEDLGLPVVKKTKTGYSTDADVLEELMDKHEIIKYISEYRGLTKLYSTYIEGLKQQMFGDMTHTVYQQALTQTGRLSSIEPNLQNIPIKTEEGKLIRKIFIPRNSGGVFVGADYSQVELRVLAHLANVDKLIEAFNNKEDVHTNTAKWVFGGDEVTDLQRRHAKAVNFGILYGQGAKGLSDQLHIGRKDAQDIIDKYFEAFPGIKTYMLEQIDFAKNTGYSKTILNRRRFIPEIQSKIPPVKRAGERIAMNTPIQGSAADIMKIAMVNVDKELMANNLKSKLVMQVHDELIIDTVIDEIEIVTSILTKEMENAYKLVVPLTVDSSYGKNWFEVK